jgi:hypothetical protein
MILDIEEYHKSRETNLEEIYFILESFIHWYEEIKDRLNDAELAIIKFLIERIEIILANRQT